MSHPKWPVIPLGELVSKSEERVPVEADQEYPNFGIYNRGRGLFEKPPISGASSSASSLYRARENQFVYSRLFAFEGAYGLVPAELDDHFVSNEFPLFTCDKERLLPEFLGWIFRDPKTWVEVAQLTTGMGSRRRRIKPEAFLTFSIALPSVQQQRIICTKLKFIADRVDEAKSLRCQSKELTNQLCRSIIREGFDDAGEIIKMKELVTWRKPDTTVRPSETYHFAGVYCFGRGVFSGHRKNGTEFKYQKLTQIHTGDFVYPKLMAWEGAMGIVPDECDGLFVSPEFPVFSIDRTKVAPEVLDVYFRSPSVWSKLSGSSTGTNVRRRRLSPNDFLEYDFPLPSQNSQNLLTVVLEKTNQLQNINESSHELDAMMPSILDRAFKGEL